MKNIVNSIRVLWQAIFGELTKANPDWFAICAVTKEGEVFEVGDIAENFTIQSISKVFVYGMALEDCDRTTLLEKIGVEPRARSL